MRNKTVLIFCGCVLAVAVALAAEGAGKPAAENGSAAATAATPAPAMPPSALFDPLGTQPDVIYLIANSSVVFGPDPHGRSEEITFLGPVTVPKWPMPGYGRRVLPDGRQQIDIELTQSELTGESYVLNGPVVLGEHPDLRSLGTITERPRTAAASNGTSADNNKDSNHNNKDNAAAATPAVTPVASKNAAAAPQAASEEVPADFVVERKVLLTTAKGILYNETAVPVRGRIDAIPPVKFEGTPTGVNVFRGMELPVALLDREGNVNGWFYSKAHMAYAVLPAAIERSFIKGTVQLKSGDKTENVEVSGPAEIHHRSVPGSGETTMEVMMLALRGHSQLLGGDIMVTETFGDRDHFSRGQLNWQGANADSKFDLFVDVYTPSAKLSTKQPLTLAGQLVDCKINGHLEKGKLNLPLLSGKAQFTTNAAQLLYDESEKPVVELGKLQLNVAERM